MTSPPTELPRWRRDVTVFLTGQTFSLLGSMLVQYAIMWHLTLETRSGSVMAVYAVVGFLPQAVVSVFGGVWADRLDRRALIIGADATIAATTLALAVLMLSGYDDLWLLYVTAAIRSAGAGIQTPAVGALLPQIVPTDKLMRVNGINATIQSAMMLVTPAVAAGLYAWASIETIFFVDVVTAMIGIGLLLLVPVPRIARTDQVAGVRGYVHDLADGVRYVARSPFVRWVLAMWGVVFVLIVAPSFLTPLMVVRSFGDEVWKLTVNELAFSIGMTLGGVAVAWWGGLRNRVHMVVLVTALFGVLNVGLGLSTSMWVFFGFMFLVGLGVPFFSTPTMTVLQERVEPERQGRVFGFVGIVMAVAMPLGMSAFGPLADRYSVESLLVAAGVALLLVVVAAVALPSGRRAMAQADAPREEPAPADTDSGVQGSSRRA
ncbi:major facilitator superfamily MFS_1 [Cellulomonas flavigena DSM 20109]|uniref:Major facilitator superfamily MFS_1 n=1 Tax=Cellulomonas flavigena (strain ATCC 482 / DSM 20109 / BCRC 11376 / JCM 18109 / NBRC 3775 / NCIMB 8073 / NRS 134) TaxID=446466 RepID=D5UIF0_CELFN|nr:MFS transporter [Cellulomonas flavigena]ADG73449.1 major facilitator superfamily MFS_1 [Cellulomonas flavigena DSM 20109]